MRREVLDHGYVELIECWGTGHSGQPIAQGFFDPDYERGMIEAARQSTQGSFRGWETDQKLLEFLYNNKHATPFEFAGMVIEVQAPIFVFREWHRHRTQSYNEASARYSPLPDLYYVPDRANVIGRGLMAAQSKNKQEMGLAEFDSKIADLWLKQVEDLYIEAEKLYGDALRIGIPKELARITMPVGHYSRMRASATLRNWLGFLTLRTAPQAQWEIRQFANAVGKLIQARFPRTYELFNPSGD